MDLILKLPQNINLSDMEQMIKNKTISLVFIFFLHKKLNIKK